MSFRASPLVKDPAFSLKDLALITDIDEDVFIYATTIVINLDADSVIAALKESGRTELIHFVETEAKIRNGDVEGYSSPGAANNAASTIIAYGLDYNDIIKIVDNHPGVCDYIDGNGCNLLMQIAYYIPEETEVFLHVLSHTTNTHHCDKTGENAFDILMSGGYEDLAEMVGD